MAGKRSKVIRYRRPIRFNIGMVVFVVFFIYLVVNVVSYMTRGNTKIYEVGEASSVVIDNSYTGLILRSEQVHTTPEAGYVNFYIREGSRTAVGSTVYSIDTNGQYTQMLNSGTTGESSLSAEQLSALKTKLAAFSASYSPEEFESVYDLKYSLQNLLFGYIASSSLEDLENLGIDTSYLVTVGAETSGIVEYYVDGYESMTEADLTMADLTDSSYQKNTVSSGTLLEAEAPVYKTIDSESWVVYLPLTEEDRILLADQSSVRLLFTDVNLEMTAKFSLITTSDGNIVGRCELSRYMVQLADRRYTNVTLEKSAISSINITGLKIPKSSVISKNFYVVPVDYATAGGNDSGTGFLKETYTAEGTVVEFITPTIYAATDEYYYLDPQEIEEGTVLRKPSGDEIYEVVAGEESGDAPEISETSEEAGAAENGETGSAEEEEDGAGTDDAETDGAGTSGTGDDAGTGEDDGTGDDTGAGDDAGTGEDDGTGDGAGTVEAEESAAREADGESASEESAAELAESEQNGLTAGTVIVTEGTDSGSTFRVDTTSQLSGVYCVNKGYAVFRQITILDESDDYYIISEGQSYGLSVYDHILLDGASSKEGDLIY